MLKTHLRIFLASCLLPLVAMAGGWSGNGGSSALDAQNIWFLGEDPIPYCVMAGPGTYPAEAIHLMIKKNAQKWNDFFTKYGMNIETFGKNEWSLFPDLKTRSLSTQFVRAQDCAEVEKFCAAKSENSDECHRVLQDKVLFLVGKPNVVVLDYLRMNGTAEGAAIRTDYNHKNYRSGGIVWVNSIRNGGWSQYSHILLHEMGHVFGMKHDSCWVMSSQVAQLSTGWSGIGQLEQIEAPNWPYSYSVGDELFFTDKRARFGNGPNGFYQNSFLAYSGLLEKLGFQKENFFQIRGKVLSAAANGIQIEMTIEEFPTGIKHILTGSLTGRSIRESNLIPQIYTLWKAKSSGSENFRTEYLKSGWVANRKQGMLNWNGENVAVTLERDRGLILGMYFPGTTQWLMLETVQY